MKRPWSERERLPLQVPMRGQSHVAYLPRHPRKRLRSERVGVGRSHAKDRVGGVGCVAHQPDHGHPNAELVQLAASSPETDLS